MAKVVNFIEAKLRNRCKNRISFNEHFIVGQQAIFEAVNQENLTSLREHLIRRSFLQDKERIADRQENMSFAI